ncbi:MAG: glucose-1-phosphate cytidylyltransferase, partial [Methanobrevibacter sp.]|nr:glucose-1-phosphate cytidylyltransferase [Methanobrevibacter sp.]
VSDVNLKELLEFHKANKKLATITAVNLAGRFGVLDIDDTQQIANFAEKTKEDGGWINGGFMVLEPQVLEYIDGDQTIFERDPLENLAKDGQLMAYKHHGYWQCMDTKRDHDLLEKLWVDDEAPWHIWK